MCAKLVSRLAPLSLLCVALELARSGAVKKVSSTKSPESQKNSVAHSFVESLEEVGVSLYWHAQRIETLMPSGKRNPAAGIMLALLAEMARNEVETLRERVLSELAEAKRKGVRLGRPPGSTVSRKDFVQNTRILRAVHARGTLYATRPRFAVRGYQPCSV